MSKAKHSKEKRRQVRRALKACGEVLPKAIGHARAMRHGWGTAMTGKTLSVEDQHD